MLKKLQKYGFAIIVLLVLLQHFAYSQSIIIKDIDHSLSKKDIAQLTAIINKEADFHANHLNLPRDLEIPIRAFESEHQYNKYQKTISKISSNNGFYSGSKKELVINKNSQYFKTILHEAQHFVLRSKFRNPLKWLNEGLSEFYETAYIDGSKIYVKKQNQKEKRLQQWLQKNEFLSLQQFLSLSNDDWKKKSKKPEYISSTISWGFVYFLMSAPDRRHCLSIVIKKLNKNPTKSSLEVLNNAYEGGLQAMEDDFLRFIKRMPSRIEI